MMESRTIMLAAYVRKPLPVATLRTAIALALGVDEAELQLLDDLIEARLKTRGPYVFDIQPQSGAFAWAVELYLRALPAGAPSTHLGFAQKLASSLGSDVLAEQGDRYGEWALVCRDGRVFIVQELIEEDDDGQGITINEDPSTWRPLIG